MFSFLCVIVFSRYLDELKIVFKTGLSHSTFCFSQHNGWDEDLFLIVAQQFCSFSFYFLLQIYCQFLSDPLILLVS